MSLGTNSSPKKKKWSVLVLCVASLVALYAYFMNLNQKYSSITSFKECVDAGYLLLEIYPEQCKMPGKTFVNKDQIRVLEATSTKERLSDILEHTYLVSGVEVGFVNARAGSATSGLRYVGLLLEDALNKDSLKDTVFVAKNENGEYYLLLSLGLYSGKSAPANGVSLGTNSPQYLLKNKNGTLRAVFACATNLSCVKDFRVINDILEPLK